MYLGKNMIIPLKIIFLKIRFLSILGIIIVCLNLLWLPMEVLLKNATGFSPASVPKGLLLMT